MPRGHQASQDERGGFRQDFPGILNQSRILPSLIPHSAVMPRDYQLETFVPSEYLAFERGLRVRKPAFFLHSLRVDAQWECDEVCKFQSRGKPFAIGEPRAVSPDFSFYLFTDNP